MKNARRYSLLTFHAALLCAFITLLGCKPLDHYSVDNNFPGLQSAMQKPVICILFVHGMGGYSNDDPQKIIDGILAMPNVRQTAPAHSIPFADPTVAGELTRQDFVDSSTGHEIRAYKLSWQAVTHDLKGLYLDYDQTPANTADRLPRMNDLRAGILDEAVPDVVLYVGKYKTAVQRTVKAALKTIHGELESQQRSTGKDFEYFFVTWSLGSKIVFDCLATPENSSPPSSAPTTVPATEAVQFNAIAEKTHSVFMLANQIPLLTLGDVPSPRQTTAPVNRDSAYENLLAVARRRKHFAAMQMPSSRPATSTQPTTQPASALSIVAVNDPNDVLSYPIPPWLEESGEAHFANVSISVAKTAYYIPLLGWIVNPIKAHTGYGIDPRVVDLIIHGRSSVAQP